VATTPGEPQQRAARAALQRPLARHLPKHPVRAHRPPFSWTTQIIVSPFAFYFFNDHSAVYELEGLRGMWRGLGPALSGVIPSRAVQFATYSFMKRTLAPILGENTSLHLVSASVAGAHDTRTHAHAHAHSPSFLNSLVSVVQA
jgi:hypothetical protein